ncbi:MAG: hypothetical protein PVJ39_14810 [Gammaproteobacteria bacterium]|jgi:hypothetical protein
MQQFLVLIDKNMLAIVTGCFVIFVLLFLLRSFRRNLLIERGQARFVLEEYDVRTERMIKWLMFIAVFVFAPLLVYARYFRDFY